MTQSSENTLSKFTLGLVFGLGLFSQNVFASPAMNLVCKTTHGDVSISQNVRLPSTGEVEFSNKLVQVQLGFTDSDLQRCSFQSEDSVQGCREKLERNRSRVLNLSQYIHIQEVMEETVDLSYRLTKQKDWLGRDRWVENASDRERIQRYQQLQQQWNITSTLTPYQQTENVFRSSKYINDSPLKVICRQVGN